MSETIYDFIASCSSYLKLDVSSERIAQYDQQNSLTDHDLEVIRELFDYLKQQKEAVCALCEEKSCIYWSAWSRQDSSCDGIRTCLLRKGDESNFLKGN